MKLTIAIDGPAGAGKSTIAKLISDKYNLMYINTGLMYRAVTYTALQQGIHPEEVSKLRDLIISSNMYFNDDRIIVNEIDITDELKMPCINTNVSAYAAVPEVRKLLVYMQQKMADKFNVIMDGRDIGTVVLKNASFKFFITASPETRARRRCKELLENGINVDLDSILKDIIKRDYIDSNREINPLSKAPDALLIDTSDIGINEVIEKISKYIESK